jgi:hypothetical protein
MTTQDTTLTTLETFEAFLKQPQHHEQCYELIQGRL